MDLDMMANVAETESDIIHVIKPEPVDDVNNKAVNSGEITNIKEEKSDNKSSASKRKAVSEAEANEDDEATEDEEETFVLPNCSVQLQRSEAHANDGKVNEMNGKSARGSRSSGRGRGAKKGSGTNEVTSSTSESGRGRGARGGRGQGGRGRGRGGKAAKLSNVNQTVDSIDVSDVSVKVEPGDEEDSMEHTSTHAPLPPQQDQITLLPSVNASHAPDLRTLFMGQTDIGRAPGEPPVELWLNLVAKRLGDEKKMVYQCYFCPQIRDIPKTVSDHMQADHEDLRFAVNRNKRVGLTKIIYFFCRHCDFVASEAVIMWIHYEAYHGLTGILDSGSNCMVKPDMDEEFNSVADRNVSDNGEVFACLDCNAVSNDKRKLSNHIVRDHGAVTEHFNGYFVKTLQIEHIAGKAGDKKPSTYRQAVELAEFAHLRKECYICFVCGFVASGAYLAISHYVSNHHHLRLLQVCSSPALGEVSSNEDCCRQYITEKEFAEHMSVDHGEDGVSARLHCSATLVRPPSTDHASETRIAGDGLASLIECVVDNRGSTNVLNGVAVAVGV